jgi:hypothetical protein
MLRLRRNAGGARRRASDGNPTFADSRPRASRSDPPLRVPSPGCLFPCAAAVHRGHRNRCAVAPGAAPLPCTRRLSAASGGRRAFSRPGTGRVRRLPLQRRDLPRAVHLGGAALRCPRADGNAAPGRPRATPWRGPGRGDAPEAHAEHPRLREACIGTRIRDPGLPRAGPAAALDGRPNGAMSIARDTSAKGGKVSRPGACCGLTRRKQWRQARVNALAQAAAGGFVRRDGATAARARDATRARTARPHPPGARRRAAAARR